jgi:hypothetical protein
MYADSSFLYVSGNFALIDGVLMKGIARWNGISWDSLGAGINGLETAHIYPNTSVSTIINFQNNLYVGGAFHSLGNVDALGVGFWDGVTWDSMPVQPEGANVLSAINQELYLGGSFDSLAGITANSIVKWNGVSWQSLDFPNFYEFPFFNRYANVCAICEFDGKIYVAGDFESYPVDTVGNILCYDGANWTSVSGGIKGFDAGIRSLLIYHGELYAAGSFYKSDGNPGENIQRYNGNTWLDVGGGTGYMNAAIDNLVVCQDKLFAVGPFQEAGGIPANWIAVWGGVKWCGTGNTFNNGITSIACFQDSVFIGGAFTTIDGDSLMRIAKWTGGDFADTCSTIDIPENEIADEFHFFPNPANSPITLTYPYNSSQVQIIDVLGRKFKTIILSAATTSQIDITDLPCGIYFLELITEQGTVTKKMIKE